MGKVDVEDCIQAKEECLKKYPHLDASRVGLYGGSHGGFLVTHLAGQYPDHFHAVVARNPVINMATKATITDIPTWNFNENGKSYLYRSPNPDLTREMVLNSPINHVENVEAPVLLLIGSKDLRVVPSQGYEYYYNLKALGKDVKMNVYEDNHPLDKVNVNADVMRSTSLFFSDIFNNKSSN